MKKILPIPENEQVRIEKLRGYEILDTEAEEMFDDLTRLAAQILQVPMCALSLIDEDRQWFKSTVGLETDGTTREISFCQYTIMETENFEVEDASRDQRFKDNPLVTENPNIHFYSGVPLRDEEGDSIGALCVLDSEPRKFTQDQRNTLKLIANSAMRMIQLRREKIEVERLTAVKDEFISNMSHEIRTPLNAIIGFNDLLSKTPLNHEQTNFLKTINQATYNLKNIINDVLDVSKLEGKKIQLEEKPISIRDLVQHCIKLQSPNAKAKNLKLISSLDHELPFYVLGDETRLIQILNNLISNSLKFTEEGSVEVKAMLVSNGGDSTTIHFEVKDTGIGIPFDKKNKIFERFEQADTSTTRLYGGTGLGLNIVKNLVSLHGSKIKLESEEGRGSVFSFKIEFKNSSDNPDKVEVRPIETNTDVLKHKNILLVEDNFHNQLLAKTYLERCGGNVCIAENGEIALELLENKNFDLILMDLQMPVMNGFVTTEKIRNELKQNIPIIGCSANSAAKEKNKCLDFGMDDYITKPYGERILIDTICNHLHLSSNIPEGEIQIEGDFDNLSSLISDLRNSLGDEIAFQAQQHFLTTTPSDIEEISLAIEKRNLTLLEGKAHKIAGTFGVLNFNRGMECAKQLETKASGQEVPQSIILAQNLLEHLNRAMKYFGESLVS